MWRTIGLCAASVLGGAILAIVLTQGPPRSSLFAQQTKQRPPSAGAPGAARPPRTQAGRGLAGQGGDDVLNELTPEERVSVNVYETVNTSVVNITTKGSGADALSLLDMPAEGTGSGSVLDSKGHILTNHHVIEDANEITVTLFNGQTFDAKLIGEDATNDIAVIKIEAPTDMLYPVSFGDSTRLRVGQRVFAIGNPFGLDRTLTTGVVSSLDRVLPSRNKRTVKSIIQIDAAINPGNSGGPLLDSHARLIGMNVAIYSRTGQSAGIGFAIPVATISRIVPQLISAGRIVRPETGIIAVSQSEIGLRVAQIAPGGPAEKAGLRGPTVTRKRRGPILYEAIDRSTADIIVAVDGDPTLTVDEFLSAIEAKRPGDEVTLTVIRQGKEAHLALRLAEAEKER
ncbi:MAG: trypsin-like peptidase domain-containing protein [Pirellulales bacterium]|nr:trypsin-like peptidase domain-containing protein [Pirellulales bacterium]